jgi:molybdate transport system substrate-binding protein
MDQVTDKGTATTFVKKFVPKSNPGRITGLADFGDAGKKIALCAEQVPCGAAAKKVFEAARITAKPDSLEQDVKAALTKVSLGEVDAALVYKTDVQAAAGKVDGIEFPAADKAINEYPIATLTKGPERDRREKPSYGPSRPSPLFCCWTHH